MLYRECNVRSRSRSCLCWSLGNRHGVSRQRPLSLTSFTRVGSSLSVTEMITSGQGLVTLSVAGDTLLGNSLSVTLGVIVGGSSFSMRGTAFSQQLSMLHSAFLEGVCLCSMTVSLAEDFVFRVQRFGDREQSFRGGRTVYRSWIFDRSTCASW